MKDMGNKREYNLPDDYRPFADKYFLRSREILEAYGLNQWVNMQVFVRRGPGVIQGVDEAVEIVKKYSDIEAVGGKIYALKDGMSYEPKDTVMNIIAPIQEIIELETVYLGVIAAETTRFNDRIDIDLTRIEENMRAVVDAAGDRPVMYFGARHWRYDRDAEISEAAFRGGASDCSSDIGARTVGKAGVGTIPHALENIFAYYNGMENAVALATEAFDKVIDPQVPRIALPDYANREITDSIATAKLLDGNLSGVRVDTPGENIMEDGAPFDGRKYWTGTGVTIEGVYALRKELDRNGFEDVKNVLTSGFGNVEKIRAFNRAEEELEIQLYDSLGVGGIFDARMSTADIVAVGEDPSNMREVHKVGRPARLNPLVRRVA